MGFRPTMLIPVANRFRLKLLFLTLSSCLTVLEPAAAEEHPNFIVINVDDLGYGDIGPYGSTNKTPHLDRMAREGRKLTSHYGAPVCSPSRSALMTGCYPKRVLPIPHVLFPGAAVGLNPNEQTIAEILKKAGYATACIGKWHLGDQWEFLPCQQGFDYYYGIPYSNDMGPAADGSKSNPDQPIPPPRPQNKIPPVDETGIRGNQPPLPLMENNTVIARLRAKDQFQFTRNYTEKATGFIRENAAKPFFLYLPHSAVHFPLYPSENFRGSSPNGLLGDWTEEVDWSVGQVLDTLRELGLDKKTFVIFTSDNGGSVRYGSSNRPLRGNKGQTFEGGIRVPTIAWWPGKIPAGTATPAITSMMDIAPTLAFLAGAAMPTDRKIDGVNQWPIITDMGTAQPPRDQFFYFRGLQLEAVRSGPWKLHLALADRAPGEKKGKPRPQLFNLENDIGELHDVAAEHPQIVEQLQKLAKTMNGDLNEQDIGPGCRPLGRVENPLPTIADDGTVRADVAGNVKQFP
jgi:arylsulfatase A-like enzyme